MSTHTEVVEDAPLWVFLKGLLYPVVAKSLSLHQNDVV